MTRYYIQGGGRVDLTRSDFKAQGGEGAIYVQGSTAYKIYTDPTRMISPVKVSELSVLNHSGIIRPDKILLNAKKRPAGYSMRHVDRAYALCQLFPKSFRSQPVRLASLSRSGLSERKIRRRLSVRRRIRSPTRLR